MAPTVTARGAAFSTTSGTGITVTGQCAAGNYLLAWVVFDNLSATTPTVSSFTTALVPAWATSAVRLASVDSPQATAAGGVRGELWAMTAASALGSGNVTAILSASVGVRSMQLLEVSGIDGTVRATSSVVSSGAAPSGTQVANELELLCWASETNAQPTFGATNGWSATDKQGTNSATGGAAANVSNATQWVISTGAGSIGTNATSATSDGGCFVISLSPAAAGPQTYAAAGTAASTSATQGTPSATLVASGTAASTSATQGSPSATLLATGTAAATSATQGNATIVSAGGTTYQVSGTAASTSATQGSPSATLLATGTAAATSATQGNATIVSAGGTTYQVSGTAASSSATQGAAALVRQVSGTAASTSGSQGAVTGGTSVAWVPATVEPRDVLTAPFASGTDLLLSQRHGQTLALAATVPGITDPIPLVLLGGSLSWDERAAPRVEGTFTCQIPGETTLNLLDPRTGVRLRVTAGYIHPGGASETHLIADLGLRTRTTRRAERDETFTLVASSDEALVIDASAVLGGTVTANTRPLAIISMLNAALEPNPLVVVTHPDATASSTVDLADRWTTIADLADQIEATCYDDGLRTWHIDPFPTRAASMSAAILRVGEGGNLTGTEANLSRTDWANQVKIRYRWTDASNVAHVLAGIATVQPGSPYEPAVAGGKILLIEREVPTSQALANAAAASVLRRMLSRSRGYTLNAPAAWWLRPGHTVTCFLVTGGTERHLVSAVDFDLASFTMTVRTRLPDLLSVIGE